MLQIRNRLRFYIRPASLGIVLQVFHATSRVEQSNLQDLDICCIYKRTQGRVPLAPSKTKGKKDLLLTKPVNPSLSRASTMKSGSSFFVDLLGYSFTLIGLKPTRKNIQE
ncbi:hypothetical protein HMPREF0322_04906 [Desulfitobacterium hafniense DP7]|uniref:Uncharacterized protein n=2 Tax=Desulfitobacterium hafniense TaxID=49338 RepID=Q24XP7_DESHY|nr:hypothetical protein HMPREF0322_04906 [Desulfitobacterium hafniense DP7]BAE83195.1 hypothetical protein DSY1406 [Desulfitobacterium hafniense Y51]